VAQSPEGPAGGAPTPKSEVGAFVIGLILGLGVGGTVLTLLSFAIVAGLTQLLSPRAQGDSWVLFFAAIPALGLGWWAVVLSRSAINFFSGALIGLAAGMLGGTALCAVMVGGLSDMH
jgi:amino acid transporter